uniref:Uncharacterized protein n=1 Tax=Macrostomum lignano TaxID=282301 RepID=A0A1I8FAJ3_9PLAT
SSWPAGSPLNCQDDYVEPHKLQGLPVFDDNALTSGYARRPTSATRMPSGPISRIHLQPFLNSPLSPADDSVNPTACACVETPVTSAAATAASAH